MTLEDLADKHCYYHLGEGYAFTPDQLRALITEAVGIVQGEPITEISSSIATIKWKTPLHHNDIGRLK